MIEITDNEYSALQEAFQLLQKIPITGSDNVYIANGAFSRIQMILQRIFQDEEKKELKKKNLNKRRKIMPSTSYEIINSLDEVALIAGTNFIFTFNVFDNNGSPLDISSGSVIWTLCYYGQPDFAVLTKNGTINPSINNQWSVKLLTIDTESLSGKFIMQPIVLDFAGQEYRSAQGVITIIPRINNI